MFSYSGHEMINNMAQSNQAAQQPAGYPSQHSQLGSGAMNGNTPSTLPSHTSAGGYGAHQAAAPGFGGMGNSTNHMIANYMNYQQQQQQQPSPQSVNMAAQFTQQTLQQQQYTQASGTQYTQAPALSQQLQQPPPPASVTGSTRVGSRSRGGERSESKVPSDVFDGKYAPPDIGKMEEVAIEIVNDPYNFTCLLKKYFERVDEANLSLKRIIASSSKDYSIPPTRLKPEMACVAPYIEEGNLQYYRAQVLTVEAPQAQVIFVDYGNIQDIPTNELKYLPASCATLPISCIQCSFDNVQPTDGRSFGAGALRAFEDYMRHDRDFNCHILSISGTKYKVELYSDNNLEDKVSEELERLGVLRRIVPGTAVSSGRRRRGQREPEPAAPRSRGREMERSQSARSGSPVSSSAKDELTRAGFKAPKVTKVRYYDVKVFQPCTPSKFSIQLYDTPDEINKLADRMKQVYDRENDDDYLDDVLPFTGCAVLVDSTWQRGYILSSSYHGCQVVLVDTQEVVSVDQDQLRALREEFTKTPVFGVKCSLEGIKCTAAKWNHEACRYFKTLVTDNNSFVAKFVSERNGVHQISMLSEDRLVNAMFVMKGWASSTDNAILSAAQDLATAKPSPFQMFCPDLGSSHTISPSYVDGPQEFYVQLVGLQKPIEDLSEKVNAYYLSNPSDKPNLSVDSYCAAEWNGDWYRGRVVSVSRDQCRVFFVDYGNTDVVPVDKIKGLNKSFKQQPMYAIKCSIEGFDGQMMERMQPIFISLVDPENEDCPTLHCSFNRLEKGTFTVSLFDNGTPLVQKMYEILYSGGGSSPTRTTKSRSLAYTPHPHVSLPTKDLAHISFSRDPHMIFVHCENEGETEKTLERIGEVLETDYRNNPPPLRNKQIGALCVTEFEEDSCFYRGQIVGILGSQVQVVFVDYGNDVTKQANEVYEMDSRLANIPGQCAPCKLADIAEPPNGWGEAATHLNDAGEHAFTLRVQDLQTEPPTVEMFHAALGRTLASVLILHGFAVDPTRPSIANIQTPRIGGSAVQVRVCHATYPGEMFIQYIQHKEPLDKLLNEMHEYYGENPNNRIPLSPADLKINAVCCAQYSDDEMYYRANIYGITRSCVKLQFQDFGNSEDKKQHEIYVLDQKFMGLETQALNVSLKDVAVSQFDWKPEMQAYLEEVTHEQTYDAHFLDTLAESEQSVVTLVNKNTGKSLSEDINRFIQTGGASAQNTTSNNAFGAASQPAPAPAPAPQQKEDRNSAKVEWPPRLDRFAHQDAQVSYGEGPDNFWVNLVDRDSKLDQLQAKMDEVYASGGRAVDRVFRYMFIAAKSPEYGQVFRAKTLNNDRERPLVIYVDYGNEEEVPRENLFELESYLVTILPCQAIRCSLDQVDRLKPEGEVPPELITVFEKLVTDKELKIKNIQSANKEKPHNDVELLLDDGRNILEVLEEELEALNGPPEISACPAAVGGVVKGALVNMTSPTDFWIQLAGPMNKITENTKECGDKLKDKPEVDAHYAVVLDVDHDNTVYRGKVLSVADTTATVRCIDYGYTRTVPLKNIFKLKKPCGEHPAQALPCTLPLEVAPENLEAVMTILKELSDKCVTVKLYSKDQDEKFLIDFTPSDHLALFGDQITSTLPSLADVEGVFSFPEVDPEQSYYISHTNNLAEFYVQKSDLLLDELAEAVSTACSTGLTPLPFPSRGTTCVVKDSQFQAWNRAIVTDILEGDLLHVYFVDYGSSEKVKKNVVRKLPEALKELPVSAVKCSLSPLPEGYLNFTALFTTVTTEQEVVLGLTSQPGHVTLSVGGSPISEIFDKAAHYATLQYSEPEVQGTCNVLPTSVETPFRMWLQLAEYEAQLTSIMAALAAYSPAAPALYSHNTGTVCAAQFPEDEQWYRALITKQGADKCTVKFVDFGNCSEVGNGNIKLLPEEHLEMPVNAVLMRLGNVRPKNGSEWDSAANDYLYTITEEKTCEMTITSVRASTHVTLSIEGEDIATKMGAEDVATYTADPEIVNIPLQSIQAGETSVFGSYVESPDKIFGQLAENGDEIMGMIEQSPDELVTVDEPFLPLQCWARSEASFYRTELLSFDTREAEVWLLDYGSKAKVPVKDLWYLKPEHAVLAAQAVPLKLDEVRPLAGTEWSADSTQTLSGLLVDIQVNITLPELTDVSVRSEASVTTMINTDEGFSVADSFKAKKAARSLVAPSVVTSYLPNNLSTSVTLYCTAVTLEADHVTVSVEMDHEQTNIQALLKEGVSEGHPDYVPECIDPGMVCVAKFSEDKDWYRAVVTGVQGDSVTVTFVDYGNSESKKRSEIQLLPAQFDSPVEYLTVKLNTPDTMTVIDKNFLAKFLIDNGLLTMKVSSKEDHYDLYLEDANLVSQTMTHSAAVGAYPPFPALAPQGVVYSCVPVEEPGCIYVQTAESEATLATIGEIMEAHTERTVITDPFKGQPVLAEFDGALYRAVVTERASIKSKVWFVDYGNSSEVASVYEIDPAEVAISPQAIRCSIDMFVQPTNKTSKAVCAALNTLLSEKEILIVESESESKGVSETVSVSMSVEGVNVRLSLLQQDLCKDEDTTIGEYAKVPLPSHPLEVEVQHTEDTALFFASRTGGEIVEPDEDDEVAVVTSPEPLPATPEGYNETMQAVFGDEGACPPVLDSVEVGVLCVTEWEEAFYRATVVWIKHDYVKVRFIDYGNTWYTPLAKIHYCPEPYRGPGLVTPFTGQYNQAPVTVGTQYLVTRTEGGEGGKVGVSVALPEPKVLKYKYTKPEVGASFLGFVSDPGLSTFVVQTEENDLETLLPPLITACAAAAAPVPALVPGAPVLGYFSDGWYRGLVRSVPKPGHAEVYYVDYGNTEVTSRMVDVSRELMEVRAQGISCRLSGVEGLNCEAKAEYDTHVFADAALTITPLSYDKTTKQFTVTVLAGEEGEVGLNELVSTANKLTKEYPAQQLGVPQNTLVTLYCSSFNNVQDFCLQQEEDSGILEQIATSAKSCIKVPKLAVKEGEPCLIKDINDNEFYRCTVTETSDSSISVLYVDYGFRVTTALGSLYDIPQDLAGVKRCGVMCQLAGTLKPEGGFSESDTENLVRLCPDTKALSVSFCPSDASSTNHSVHVLVDNKPLLAQVGEGVVDVVGVAELGYPVFAGEKELLVCVVNDPTDIYLQRAEDGDPLTVVLDMLEAKTDKETVLTEPKSGMICAALSEADGTLYRAKITAVEEAGVTVQYVDYGNYEMIPGTSLYSLHPHLYSYPVLAVPVSLPTTLSQFSEDCLNKLAELLVPDTAVKIIGGVVQKDGKTVSDVILTADDSSLVVLMKEFIGEPSEE